MKCTIIVVVNLVGVWRPEVVRSWLPVVYCMDNDRMVVYYLSSCGMLVGDWCWMSQDCFDGDRMIVGL